MLLANDAAHSGSHWRDVMSKFESFMLDTWLGLTVRVAVSLPIALGMVLGIARVSAALVAVSVAP